MLATTSGQPLTVTGAANRELVNRSTILRWIRAGVRLSDGSLLFLRHKQQPRRLLVYPEWLDEFTDRLKADRRQARPAPIGKSAAFNAAIEATQ